MTSIRVVSMAGAAERRKTFSDGASRTTAPWSFFDAATELPRSLSYSDDEAQHVHGRVLGKGELGCYASHYLLWEELLSGVDEQMIILEDDVVVDWNVIERLCAVDLGQKGIDYLRLYYKHPVSYRLKKKNFAMSERFLVQLLGRPAGTQGYIITKAGARIFLNYCQRVTRPIDVQMDRYWDHRLPNMALFPAPIFERMIDSSIGDARYGSGQRSADFRKRERRDRLKRKVYNFRTRLFGA